MAGLPMTCGAMNSANISSVSVSRSQRVWARPKCSSCIGKCWRSEPKNSLRPPAPPGMGRTPQMATHVNGGPVVLPDGSDASQLRRSELFRVLHRLGAPVSPYMGKAEMLGLWDAMVLQKIEALGG